MEKIKKRETEGCGGSERGGRGRSGGRRRRRDEEGDDDDDDDDGTGYRPYWRLDENAKYNPQRQQDAASLRSNVGKKQCSHHGSNPFARYPAILSSPTYLCISLFLCASAVRRVAYSIRSGLRCVFMHLYIHGQVGTCIRENKKYRRIR